MDPNIMAAQQALIEKRKALGLTEQGIRPGLEPLGASLKQAVKELAGSAPLRSVEDLTWTCPECSTVIPPFEFTLLDQVRRLPGHCPICFPKRQAEQEEARRLADITNRKEPYLRYLPFNDPEYRNVTLETLSRRPGFELTIRCARKFAGELPHPDPYGLLLWGTRGNGKTGIAVALARTADTKGMTVAWMDGHSTLRDWGELEADQRGDQIRLFTRADMLVIDDLGSDNITVQRAGWLFTVIDHFYRKRKPVVVTSNYDPDQLVKALTPVKQGADDLKCQDGERILSRLAQMCTFVQNTATDYRMEMAFKRQAAATGRN